MQMIVVRHINGQTRYIQAQSWRQLDSESAPLGAILLRSGKDGGRLYAVKSSIYEVEEVSQEAWDAQVAIHAQIEAEKAKAEAEARKPWNRIKRLFGRKA